MRPTPRLLLAVLLAASAAPYAAAGDGVPWRQYRAPFNFLFGNEIDTHQQTRVERDGSLRGWLYVRDTGAVTSDGYPVAGHTDCNMNADCYAGWSLVGRPATATLVRQPMHEPPLFWMPRSAIPQPGGYSHFHWSKSAMPMPYVAVNGHVMELKAIQRFCFIHHMADAAMPSLSCEQNGGVAVDPGIDTASHLNIVTVDPSGM